MANTSVMAGGSETAPLPVHRLWDTKCPKSGTILIGCSLKVNSGGVLSNELAVSSYKLVPFKGQPDVLK